jgi:hypothetical protein
MLFREIYSVHCENNKKNLYTIWAKCKKFRQQQQLKHRATNESKCLIHVKIFSGFVSGVTNVQTTNTHFSLFKPGGEWSLG